MLVSIWSLSILLFHLGAPRADVSTSLAVFVGLIGSMMGYPLLDPLAGLLVAGLIVRQVRIRSLRLELGGFMFLFTTTKF